MLSYFLSSVADKTKNRGFAFVEYENHRAAAVARRKFMPNRLQLWGKTVAVDWAEPEPVVDDEVLSKVTIAMKEFSDSLLPPHCFSR